MRRSFITTCRRHPFVADLVVLALTLAAVEAYFWWRGDGFPTLIPIVGFIAINQGVFWYLRWNRPGEARGASPDDAHP